MTYILDPAESSKKMKMTNDPRSLLGMLKITSTWAWCYSNPCSHIPWRGNLADVRPTFCSMTIFTRLDGMEGARPQWQESCFDNNASNLSVFFPDRRTISHDAQPCCEIQ